MNKSDLIVEYLKEVDFKGDFNINLIKDNLKKLIGETPGVKCDWTATKSINENTKKEIREEKLKSVSVFYTNPFSNNVEKIEYYVE
jgi:hypothetical protein